LLTVTVLLADKMNQEQHNSLESYSLLSGIPIRHLIALEAHLLELLNYDLATSEEDIDLFLRREFDGQLLPQTLPE
jgi:hypothetical protein